MKALLYLLFALPLFAIAQPHTPLPHGMVFGQAPERVNLLKASSLESYMGNQTRTSAIIEGTVLRVIKPKGGWFELDAGNGKVISAHFRNYDVNLPVELKGRDVIIEGIASRQFVAGNHPYAVSGRNTKPTPKKLIFEVTGLYVNK